MNNQNINLGNSIIRSPLRCSFILIPLALAFGWAALVPQAQAVCPQGCDSNANTFLGEDAFNSNTTGFANTAIGVDAMILNSTGSDNTANGAGALYFNTTGSDNTAYGFNALFSNNGSGNTAVGYQALSSNATNGSNTATGYECLYHSTGNANTGYGQAALYNNSTGGDNTAVGSAALYENTTGSNNIAIGGGAGFSLTTGSNNIDIANSGVAAEAGTIRIGTGGTQTATFIAGIYRVAVSGAVPVGVSSSGQLGVRASSAGFKENIQAMGKSSEAILSLKPVSFRYKKELDPKGAPEFGLIAEEVAKVAPDLVILDDQGKPFTVRYDEVNAMLLNEFLKAHRKVEEQAKSLVRDEGEIAQLKSALAEQRKNLESRTAQQEKEIAALSAGFQKVSARLESRQPGTRVVAEIKRNNNN